MLVIKFVIQVLKCMVISMLYIFLLLLLVGCNNNDLQNIDMDLLNYTSNSESFKNDVNVGQECIDLDICAPSICQNCEEIEYGSQVKVMIKSIELYENENAATLLITCFEDSRKYLDKFQVSYNEAYYELYGIARRINFDTS